MCSWISVKGRISRGHGVASGQSGDSRFPNGTLEMQKPFFRELGLNLDEYYMGTLNVAIAPKQYRVISPKYTFKAVKWSPNEPPEDFSFFDCRVLLKEKKRVCGLIYYPHPETKPEHFQSPDTLEVLLPFVDGLNYEDDLVIEIDERQLELTN